MGYLFRRVRFHPNDFEIIEPFEVRTWTANMGESNTEQFLLL